MAQSHHIRHKFDWVKGIFLDENKFEVSGIVTTMDVDGYSGKTNLSWGFGGEISLGFGVSEDLKLNIDINKFINALQPFSQYENIELQNRASGSKSFNPSEY